MGEIVRLRSARDGFEYEAYRAGVSDARRGGLVVLHAIWGVTPHLSELADDYAEAGYEVLVPSLFDRLRRGFAETNFDPALMARQNGFAEQTHWGADVLDAVQAAIDALAPPVFAMGFCFGGTTAWLAAARCTGLAAVASFYGGQIVDYMADAPQAPTILHLGKADELIPPADVEAIRAAYPDLPVYMYDAGHAFVAPNGFHEDSARLSKLRTLAHFSRNSGVRGEA
ncbi:MAG TPA: dienelactone hydrolase family protein [Phenylobacterium sp.]|jgi:carboxymethylenebutenolidase|uniref:dienelactone hydrolase family protein n=1 Tax=Phenylobacterium sp. TaxID=1871053 RepID=UPI002C7746A4|nr:dienelactone hydrolase family protein [Phenylobacterium sp.]HXA39099.1 dienelactone hydrolase family protein [Phenylobacterium sp.]